MVSHAFGLDLGKFLVVYFDDILVYNITKSDHITHLRQVCETLRQEKFYTNLKKYAFLSDHMTFLRFIASIDGLRADPTKIQAIKE